MLTIGIDLAADDSKTAIAAIRWTADEASLEKLTVGADDARLIQAIMMADKAGIDCPLGWPEPFVDFVVAHQRRDLVAQTGLVGKDWRRSLAWRRTDLVTRKVAGRLSLSVSADRLAHVAMRCAALQARLAEAGHPVDRAGGGVVVEVYPAASLSIWELPHSGFKGHKKLGALNEVVDKLTSAAPRLRLGAFEAECRANDDAFDAVVAALTARAAAVDVATRPGPDDLTLAASEGWIALPTAPLNDLFRR